MTAPGPTLFTEDELRAQADEGKTMAEAAAYFGCSVQPVWRWAQDWKIRFRDGRQDAIDRRRKTGRVSMTQAMADLAAGASEADVAKKYNVPMYRAVFAQSLLIERRERNSKRLPEGLRGQ